MKDKGRIRNWALVGLTIFTIVLFLVINLSGGGWVFYRVLNSVNEGNIGHELQYWALIQDNIQGIYWDQSESLLRLEQKALTQEITRDDLKSLYIMSGVVDAFYINMISRKSININPEIPVDSILASEYWLEKQGATVPLARRRCGGLTKFQKINQYTILYRPIGVYDPVIPEEVIGLVLDREWFLSVLPAKLDSLGTNSLNITMFGRSPIDSLLKLQVDPYASPGGWKRTLGVMDGVDTLWWKGDPSVKITDEMDALETGGRVIHLDGLDVNVLARCQTLDWREEIFSGADKLALGVILFDILILTLIFFLYKTIRLHRKQAQHNRVALAHFAHAIKTPVARLRLGSDMLLDDQVASPEQEKSLVESISGECDRLELSVKNAAIAIERGKIEPVREKCDLSDLTSSILNSWENTFGQYKVELKIIIPESSIDIEIDREMIRNLIDNLIDNALRHTYLNKSELDSGKAVVRVELIKSENDIRIFVDDSGKGIPEEERKQLFAGLKHDKPEALTGVS
ncbi:MAG: HAMP domain-containing histidine kinase, partial [Calditrichaeota bacterium]|nr:HAMP domain-containing histidine kinase [Calditrichota bacterium]